MAGEDSHGKCTVEEIPKEEMSVVQCILYMR
jgi:hypothetical protein